MTERTLIRVGLILGGIGSLVWGAFAIYNSWEFQTARFWMASGDGPARTEMFTRFLDAYRSGPYLYIGLALLVIALLLRERKPDDTLYVATEARMPIEDNCPECGGLVKSTAVFCPHCGHVNAKDVNTEL